MMQRWGADAIRFMRDASEYGTYHKELAAIVRPWLPAQGHVCDAGCGLGYLSQELATFCAEITAIDRAEAAINAMKTRNIPMNLNILCDDIFKLDAKFDAMIFCYFGKTDEILRLAEKMCRGNVLIVKRECARHSFSIGRVAKPRYTVEDTLQTLLKMDVPCERKKLLLEMGQPFRNFDDALTFFRLYNKSDETVEPAAVKKRLQATGRVDFPLYLPNTRAMELIVFDANCLRR